MRNLLFYFFSSNKNYKIDVYDISRKLISTTLGNKFNIQSLEKGNYIIKLTSDNLNSVSAYKILRK